MANVNISYLPAADASTSNLYLRAWGRQMLRAVGFVGVDVEQREQRLWDIAEDIAAVHEHHGVQRLYQTLVELAVEGRGMLSDA